MPPPPISQTSVTAQILTTVCYNFVVYFLIGLPLAVLPGFVHFTLGRSAAVAGFFVSAQYLATLLSRAVVGKISDTRGPKSVVLGGLGCAAVSGLCLLAAGSHAAPAWLLLSLGLSRLWLGMAESGSGTGCITWGIGRVGAAHTAEVISWNGVASYGGIAIGAPVGVMLDHSGGLPAIGLATAGLALAALLPCSFKAGSPPAAGARIGFGSVFWRVLPYGMTLALGSIGFGTIVTFITLLYAGRGWTGAAYGLSAFGIAFVAVRILGSGAIRRFGGLRTSLVSLTVECIGLLVIWLAASERTAILGTALTGLGLSLIFPAMAVEALKTVPVANRGAAVGAYTVFLDVALGATGPLAGLAIGRFGYPSAFLLAAIATVAAACITLRLFTKARADSQQDSMTPLF
jgi:predicted MFS family arabinose efflux permease